MCVHYIIRIYFRFTRRLCAHVFSISKTFKTKLISPAIEKPDCGDIISAKLIKKKNCRLHLKEIQIQHDSLKKVMNLLFMLIGSISKDLFRQ